MGEAERDRAKLKLVAPKAGTVLPPTLVPESPNDTALPTWSGSPLKRENLGALLVTGTKICEIGDPRWLEARLVIDQGDVELVEPGQTVEVMLRQSSDFVYVSKIEKKASKELKSSPAHLSSLNGGDLPTKMDQDGVARPIGKVFEVLVPLPEDEHGMLRIGLVGQARITTRTAHARQPAVPLFIADV